jgi:tetratricopeptide (TPR) repeat protein
MQPADAAQSKDVQKILDEVSPMLVRGEFAASAEKLSGAVERFPAARELRLELVKALWGLKQWAPAHEQMAKALELGAPTAELAAMAGTLANAAGLPEKAIEHYQQAQTLDSANPQYPLYLGMVQRKQGLEAQAMANLLRAATLDPDLAEAWGTLGDIALARNEPNVALQHAEKAATLQPDRLAWRTLRARAQNRLNQPQKAVDLLINLQAEQRADATTLATLTSALGLLRRFEDSAAQFESAARVHAGKPEALHFQLQAARLYLQAGKLEKAHAQAKLAEQGGAEGAAALLVEIQTKHDAGGVPQTK